MIKVNDLCCVSYAKESGEKTLMGYIWSKISIEKQDKL